MTDTTNRPQAVTTAARENARQHAQAAADALAARISAVIKLGRKLAADDNATPTLEETVEVLQALTTVTVTEREAALDLAADLRMMGVSRHEVAHRANRSYSALGEAMSSRPWAAVTTARELTRSHTGTWAAR
ncbi:hypothetical protein ACTXJJ_06370 [Corynebacterium casei]|uniref:hypothetical protein n=1 Tax=Corynebacterium casei TaxID=160386 RepID=UPI003FB87123